MSVVSELTYLSARQSRYYEAMSSITPKQSKGNQRLYTPEEVTLIDIQSIAV
jgi:DNA-binding transcriptional MerR regulator